jgi:hypothetical protein
MAPRNDFFDPDQSALHLAMPGCIHITISVGDLSPVKGILG